MAPAMAVASSTVPYRPPVVMLDAWMLVGSYCDCESSTVIYRPPVVMFETWMLYGSCCGCGLKYNTVQASSSDVGGLDVVWLLLWLWLPVQNLTGLQ